MMIEVAGIGLNPNLIAEAGAYTLGGVELLKRYVPGLFPSGKAETRSVVWPGILAALSAVTGVGPFAGMAWATAAIHGVIGGVAAGVAHDKVAKVTDPILDKLPGQKKEG